MKKITIKIARTGQVYSYCDDKPIALEHALDAIQNMTLAGQQVASDGIGLAFERTEGDQELSGRLDRMSDSLEEVRGMLMRIAENLHS